MQTLEEEYYNYIIDVINQSKDKAIEMDSIPLILADKYGDEYSSKHSIKAKEMLLNNDVLEFFSEGVHLSENLFYYSVGNWIAIKGKYENVIKMKQSIGIANWELKIKDEIVDRTLC